MAVPSPPSSSASPPVVPRTTRPPTPPVPHLRRLPGRLPRQGGDQVRDHHRQAAQAASSRARLAARPCSRSAASRSGRATGCPSAARARPLGQGHVRQGPELIGTMEPELRRSPPPADLIVDPSQRRPDPLRHPEEDRPDAGRAQGRRPVHDLVEQQTTMIAAAMGVPREGQGADRGDHEEVRGRREAHPEFKDATIVLGSRTSRVTARTSAARAASTSWSASASRTARPSRPRPTEAFHPIFQGEPRTPRRRPHGDDPDRHPRRTRQRPLYKAVPRSRPATP